MGAARGCSVVFFNLSCREFISNEAEMVIEVYYEEGKGYFLSGCYTF
jgi:hypothetical protein